MFTAIMVVCAMDYSNCQSLVDKRVFKEEDMCLEALAIGYERFEKEDIIIAGYACYKWERPNV